MFFVNEVGTDSKGRPYIKMVEVNENAEQRGEQVHTEERSVAVRDVQEAQGIHADVRGVSETDSAGNSDGKIDLQGERTGKVNTTEQLHEEVTEQIERTSTVQPKGQNFVIGDSLDLPKGEKARYKANVEAIRIVKQLGAAQRDCISPRYKVPR